MSIFYLLPPRPFLAEHFVSYLRGLFPGLDWDLQTRLNLTAALDAAATCQPDVFVIFRDELPDGETTFHGLTDAFGAEDGDEVIEVRAGAQPGELIAHRWRVRSAA